jgi:hypothetical protein
MPTGVERIAAERQRQVTEEGWTPEHDDSHRGGAMAFAAACYAAPTDVFSVIRGLAQSGFRVESLWPWDRKWDKRSARPASSMPKDIDGRIRDLEKAGALCAAEIDRLQREKVRRGLPASAAA